MSEDETPEGCHWEWLPCGPEWQTPADGRKCSKAGCLHQAVAMLQRLHKRFTSGFAWWGYCADHMYGRKIENGVVKERRLVVDGKVQA